MERKVSIITLLSVIVLLALISIFTSSHGYVAAACIAFPFVLLLMNEDFKNLHWVILVVGMLLITISSVNLLANLQGHFMFYYEMIACIFIFSISFLYKEGSSKIGKE